MNIIDVLPEKNIKIGLRSNQKEDVILELLDLCEKNELLKEKSIVFENIMERERLMSTGIGKGVAFPHCKVDFVDNIILVFGRRKSGIEYETLDNQTVQLVFLLISPIDAASDHINVLARLSRMVKLDYFRETILSLTNVSDIYEFIKKEDKKFL